MQRLKLRIEESGEKLSAAYAPPKWSETAGKVRVTSKRNQITKLEKNHQIFHDYLKLYIQKEGSFIPLSLIFLEINVQTLMIKIIL